MIKFLHDWYQRYFTDPQVVLLALLLIMGFAVVLFAGKILAPLIAAIVIAYLLDGAVVMLEHWHLPRWVATTIVFILFLIVLTAVLVWLIPLLSRQVVQFFAEVPNMFSEGQRLLMQLPQKYPDFISDAEVAGILGRIRSQVAVFGQQVVSLSLASVLNLITVLVYLILVPVLIFFLLKDKQKILNWFGSFLPRERSLSMQVWNEMNAKIASYARGKFVEIIITWLVSYITFSLLGLNYAMLLSVAIGLSVIIPYVGAAAAGVPVLLISYFQFGWSSQTYYILIAYAVIQFLDGNILVPVLFSEVVNLHPVAIIAAVLIFGGIWGLWGIFFAIPLATLVQAVINAWPKTSIENEVISETV
jgi:putative permease